MHNVDSTGLAAAALKAHGADTSRSAAWLAGQQVTSGPTVGTGASRGALKYHGSFDPSASIKATADGILGLAGNGSLATLSAAGAAAGTAVLALERAHPRPLVRLHRHAQTITGTGFAAGETVLGELHSTPMAVGRAARASPARCDLHRARSPREARGRRDGARTGRGRPPSSRRGRRPAGATPSPSAPGPALADTGRDSRQLAAEASPG